MLVWQDQSINDYKCVLLLSLLNRKIERLKKVNEIKRSGKLEKN